MGFKKKNIEGRVKEQLFDNNCVFMYMKDYNVYYKDVRGFIKCQKYEHLIKHKSSIIDKKLTEDQRKHNYILLCNKNNFTYIDHEEKFTSRRVIEITYKCNDCSNIFTVEYRSIERSKTCQNCAGNLLLDYNYVKNKMLKEGLFLLESKYINAHTKMRYFCIKHSDVEQYITWNDFDRGTRCRCCFVDSFKGENNHNWKGGVSFLYDYLKSYLSEWKKESMRVSGYKCIITKKSGNFIIHHLKSYNLIINEIEDELKINTSKTILDFNEKEVENIKEICLNKHFELLGVCLRPDIHLLFHKLYKYGNNTPEQFEEFKKRYNMGEFNKLEPEVNDYKEGINGN